jgi:hypothetical protein
MSKKKTISRAGMTQTDSKGKVTREARDNSAGDEINYRWFLLDGEELAQSVAATLKHLQWQQTSRTEQLISSTRLYGNATSYNVFGSALSRSGAGKSTSIMNHRVSFNLCQSVIDTLVAKMSKNKVVPTFITNGGVWNVQKKAKDLTKFAQGFCYGEDVHKKSIDAFCDGGIWGDGFVHVYRKDDKACVERTLPHEIWTDEIEGVTAKPTQLHYVKIMDRDIAKEMFPKLKKAIDDVEPGSYLDLGGQGTIADLIIVSQSWKLKTSKDATNGVHAVTIGNDAYKEEYDKDYFPFPHFRYVKRPLGWYGQGACERLANIQYEINKSMILKQRSLWMMGSFKVLLENGSKVVSQHLNNDIGTLVHYTGTPPQYVTPPATNPETQAWIDSLIDKGYRQEGVSQLSAAAERPLGVDSGKAMRTLTNIEDDRFLFVGQEMEAFTLEIVRQAIDVVKDICEETKTYEVVFPSTNFIQTIDWKDIDLEADQYVLKAYPTSELSEDLTGRLSEVQEMMQAGLVSPRTGQRMMNMPDIEMQDNLANAAENRLHQIFEDMLDDGKYTSPEAPWHDLTLAKQLVMEYYNYAEYMKAPDSRLALLQRFNVELGDAMGLLSPPAPLQGGTPVAPGGSTPMAAPQPTPQSNLIPNTAGAMQ